MATEYFNDAWRIPNNKNQSLVSNYSMDFDGTSSLVNIDTINSSISSSAKGSVSCWVKWDGSNALRSVGFGSNSVDRQYIVIQINPDGKAYAQYKTSSITGWQLRTTSSITANVWTHFVIVQNGTSPIIYINGSVPSQSFVEATNKTRWWPNLNSFNTSTIGALRWNSSGTLAFSYGTGKIDQVSIFDYALSATGTNSVATLYGGGTAVTNPMALSPKPISYYQLGDQTASNNTTEPNPPVQSYLVPNNSLQDYVFQINPSGTRYISIPSITISPTATISAWVNIILFSSATQQAVFGSGTNRWAFFQGGGFVKVLYNDGTTLGIIQTTLLAADFINKWHHIALVQNGGGATLYIDNVNEGTYVTGLITPTFIYIGYYPIFNGFVSNAAIFNEALPATGTESIASLYNNGSPALDISSYNGLQRWYKLNAQDTFDGTDWTIKDYAGSNDGTSVNMTSANLVTSDLQHTSGYSPYALDFDGVNDFLRTYNIPQRINQVSLSIWINRRTAQNSSAGIFGIRNSAWVAPSYGLCYDIAFSGTTRKIDFRISEFGDGSAGGVAYKLVQSTIDILDDIWYHIVGVADGTNVYIYINGVLQDDQKTYDGTLKAPTSDLTMSCQYVGSNGVGQSPFNGKLSNASIFNYGLNQSQVTEIYNQGVPSNLNNFSGTAPTGWWQIGSNSSFNGINRWACLDEIGTNDADSGTGAMAEDDIVNGVGYSGNGLGTSSIEIVGDAPYSTANGISENMDVLDRTTDVPPTV